jgi:hypothetical protein
MTADRIVLLNEFYDEHVRTHKGGAWPALRRELSESENHALGFAVKPFYDSERYWQEEVIVEFAAFPPSLQSWVLSKLCDVHRVHFDDSCYEDA